MQLTNPDNPIPQLHKNEGADIPEAPEDHLDMRQIVNLSHVLFDEVLDSELQYEERNGNRIQHRAYAYKSASRPILVAHCANLLAHLYMTAKKVGATGMYWGSKPKFEETYYYFRISFFNENGQVSEPLTVEDLFKEKK